MVNRVTLTLDHKGDITRICSDEPVELYFVNPHTPHDKVYLYGSVEVGPQFVQQEIGGYAVGHATDGTLTVGEPVSPFSRERSERKLPPSRPKLRVITDEDS